MISILKVTEQSRDNPVFYVQYAHARACSVLRQSADHETAGHEAAGHQAAGSGVLDQLGDPAEMAVLRQLASWPKLVVSAANAHEPHRVAFYLMDLAATFHALWTAGRENPTCVSFVKMHSAHRCQAAPCQGHSFGD